MRIAIANWSNRIVGGAERYVASITDYFVREGHELSFWYELDKPEDREPIPALAKSESWNVSELGLQRAIDGLRCWAPDVVYCQSMRNPAVESELLDIAPTVFFAHDHSGICISGTRATYFPTIQPCKRQFGKGCLLNFYPRRCGGLNPLTMMKDYHLNTRRLDILKRYSRVLTHSDAMEKQYREHGVAAQKVRFFVDGQERAPISDSREMRPDNSAWRLLMMGRMTEVKGGRLLLESLPLIAEHLARPLDVTLCGDGPCREAWERRATEIERNHSTIKIRFTGWLHSSECHEIYRNVDLLTLPSVWAEPFGMVGLEAGLAGVPCVAFEVGGVSQWLIDGVNGCLARGNSLNASNLGKAVIRALSDDAYYGKLRAGARLMAENWTIQQHYEDLVAVFRSLHFERESVAG